MRFDELYMRGRNRIEEKRREENKVKERKARQMMRPNARKDN